jgi:hypothetical protein
MTISTVGANYVISYGAGEVVVGASALSTTLGDLFSQGRRPPPSSETRTTRHIFKPLEETKEIRLFNIIAALKMAVAEVSMHLDPTWRARLFRQIDMLHEPDDWDDEDKLADQESFKTFLHMILQYGCMHGISLGIDNDGRILAGWEDGSSSLSFSFLPKDKVRWSVVHRQDEDIESASGISSLDRLPAVLQPYNPKAWYDNADNIPSR